MTTLARADATLLRYRLDKPVGGSGVAVVDVVIVDLEDGDGTRGLGFSYVLGGGGDAALLLARQQLDRHLLAQPVAAPQAVWRRVARGFNRSGLGPNLIALAAIDVAMWDLHARRHRVSLAEALGGAARAVPVYGSSGFDPTQSPAAAAEVALSLVERGHQAVKPRVGGARRDAEVLAAVRRAVPGHVHVMADANEKCDLPTALWLLAVARDQEVLFVEEPLPAASLDGYRTLAKHGGAAVATGEHLQGLGAFVPFAAEGLAGVLQPDLAMAGGLTPILHIAALCEAFGVSVSPHFLPGLFVHLAAASSAVAWLEDFPLLEPLFEGWPVMAADGTLAPGTAAGHGLSLHADARRRYTA